MTAGKSTTPNLELSLNSTFVGGESVEPFNLLPLIRID